MKPIKLDFGFEIYYCSICRKLYYGFDWANNCCTEFEGNGRSGV